MKLIHDYLKELTENCHIEAPNYYCTNYLECSGEVCHMTIFMVRLFGEVITEENNFSQFSTKTYTFPPGEVIEQELQFRWKYGFTGDSICLATGEEVSPLKKWRESLQELPKERFHVRACLEKNNLGGPKLVISYNTCFGSFDGWIKDAARALPSLEFVHYYCEVPVEKIDKRIYQNGVLIKEEHIYGESEIEETMDIISEFRKKTRIPDECDEFIFTVLKKVYL